MSLPLGTEMVMMGDSGLQVILYSLYGGTLNGYIDHMLFSVCLLVSLKSR